MYIYLISISLLSETDEYSPRCTLYVRAENNQKIKLRIAKVSDVDSLSGWVCFKSKRIKLISHPTQSIIERVTHPTRHQYQQGYQQEFVLSSRWLTEKTAVALSCDVIGSCWNKIDNSSYQDKQRLSKIPEDKITLSSQLRYMALNVIYFITFFFHDFD